MTIPKKKFFFAAIFLIIIIFSILLYKKASTVVHLSHPKDLRGKIITENGQTLAYSDVSYHILLDFKLINNIKDINKLSDSIHLFPVIEKFRKDKMSFKKEALINLKNVNRYFLVAKNLNENQAVLMKNWITQNIPKSKKALIVEQTTKRVYPFNDNAARTIGKCNVINGQTGIEYSYNNYLQKNYFQNSSNITWKIDSTHQTEKNFDVVTSLDIDLSGFITNTLNEKLITSKADRGLCILQESNSGKIISMVNLGKTAKNSFQEIRNYALLNIQPGNLIKPILASGFFSALNTNDSLINRKLVENYIRKNDDKIENDIIKQLSTKKLNNYLEAIKFNANSGIDLAGEQLPFLKLFKDSLSNELSKYALEGKELVGISPIKLSSYYSAIANNGILNTPIVVTKLISHIDNSIYFRDNRTPIQLIDPNTNTSILRCLCLDNIDSIKIAYISDKSKVISEDKSDISLQDLYIALFKIKEKNYTMLVCINGYNEEKMPNSSVIIAKQIIQKMLTNIPK